MSEKSCIFVLLNKKRNTMFKKIKDFISSVYVVYHYKGKDVMCPPSLEGMSDEQRNQLHKVWHFFGGTYIEDSMGVGQVDYAILTEIPFGNCIIKRLTKEYINEEF